MPPIYGIQTQPMLDQKLQIKPGQTIAVIDCPTALVLNVQPDSAERADALLVFVKDQSELDARVKALSAAAERSALVWLAYPKAKLLGTDLNRDLIREYVLKHHLDTVRQVAIDDTWSALRLKRG